MNELEMCPYDTNAPSFPPLSQNNFRTDKGKSKWRPPLRAHINYKQQLLKNMESYYSCALKLIYIWYLKWSGQNYTTKQPIDYYIPPLNMSWTLKNILTIYRYVHYLMKECWHEEYCYWSIHFRISSLYQWFVQMSEIYKWLFKLSLTRAPHVGAWNTHHESLSKKWR